MIRGSVIPYNEDAKYDMKLDVNIHNRFDIEVIDGKTGEVKQRAEAYNVICNNYWTRLAANLNYVQSWFNYIHYGSGSGTPSETDTSMFEYRGSGSTYGSTYGLDREEGYIYHRKQIQLSEQTSVGITITEVGIAFNSAGDSACTHAMLQDMNGNRISILKTDTDIINIYATVYLHYNPEGYENGTVYLGINEQLIRILSSSDGYYSGLIPLLLGCDNKLGFQSIGGMYFAGPPASLHSYFGDHKLNGWQTVYRSIDAETRQITLTLARMSISKMNTGSGIRSCIIGGVDNNVGEAKFPEIVINSPGRGLPGTDIVSEVVGTGDGITVDFSTKFPFPDNASVYVDGVLNTDVVVESKKPGGTASMSTFLEYMPKQSKSFGTVLFGVVETPPVQAERCYICGQPLGPGPHEAVYYNPLYEYGVRMAYWPSYYTYTVPYIYMEVSDDLINWTRLPSFTSQRVDEIDKNTYAIQIPEAYQHYKYWSPYYPSMNGEHKQSELVFLPVEDISKNIHFTTPPSEGSVITIDYYTPVVAKDENHVFDLTVTVQLGEYHE